MFLFARKALFKALLASFVLCSSVYAETELTCPSIATVKSHHGFGRWLPLYIKGEELASDTDVENFISSAIQLERAEWSTRYLEAGHCFYRGNNQITLAQRMIKPDPELYSGWNWVPGKFICVSANEDNCLYGGIG